MTDETAKSKKEDLAAFPVGQIVGFHGLRGEVKVRPASNNHNLFADLERVQIKDSAEALTLTIKGLRLEKGMLFLSFNEFADRTAVEHLLNVQLYTWNTELQPLESDEFWVKDLIGMQVFGQDGTAIGRIVDIAYGGNHLLEIRREQDPPGKTILIPFVKDLVPVVDLKSRRVELAELPGLLDAQ